MKIKGWYITFALMFALYLTFFEGNPSASVFYNFGYNLPSAVIWPYAAFKLSKVLGIVSILAFVGLVSIA